MLQMAACLVRLAKHAPDPATPSAMVPTFKKKSKPKRRNKRGAKPGHPGKRREDPPKITHQQHHAPLDRCPDCGEPLGPPSPQRRFRVIKEIVETEPEAVQYSTPRTKGMIERLDGRIADIINTTRFASSAELEKNLLQCANTYSC